MRVIVVAFLLAITIGPTLSAQDDPKECAAIANNSKRLECFDLIFKRSSVTSQVKSAWEVREEKSKIDYFTNVFLTLKSLEPIRNQYGQVTNLQLLIFCREKKTDLICAFRWALYVEYGGPRIGYLSCGQETRSQYAANRIK